MTTTELANLALALEEMVAYALYDCTRYGTPAYYAAHPEDTGHVEADKGKSFFGTALD